MSRTRQFYLFLLGIFKVQKLSTHLPQPSAVKRLYIDISKQENKDALVKFLKSRGSKLDEKTIAEEVLDYTSEKSS